MLALLYVVYIIIYAKLKPSVAPPLSEEDQYVPLPKFAEVISTTKSNNALVGLIGALKGKRNADVPLKTVLNHLIIAILPLLAVGFFVFVIWLWTTAPTLLDTAGVQEMGFAAEEAGTEGARPMPEGLPNRRDPQAWRNPRPNRRRRRRPPRLHRRSRSRPPRRPRRLRRRPAPAPPERHPPSLAFWITFGICAAGLVIFYAIFTFVRLEIFKMLLGSFFPLAILILGVLGADHRGAGDADRGGGDGVLRRVGPGGRLRTVQLDDAQGVGLPHREDLGHGLLALRRVGHLRRGLRPPRRPGDHQRPG